MREKLEALAAREGETIVVRSPGVGLWSGAPELGAVVIAGASLGQLSVLGRRIELTAGASTSGRVTRTGDAEPENVRAVGYGDVLLVLHPHLAGSVAVVADDRDAASSAALVFRSPSSGRFYSRPDPSKPPFVAIGDVIARGQAVCMLEVMKTYSRVRYGGDGVPESARVVAIRPIDQDDIGEGDVILELEAAP